MGQIKQHRRTYLILLEVEYLEYLTTKIKVLRCITEGSNKINLLLN